MQTFVLAIPLKQELLQAINELSFYFFLFLNLLFIPHLDRYCSDIFYHIDVAMNVFLVKEVRLLVEKQ